MPALAMKIAAQGVVKITALIIKTVIVGDALVGKAPRGVVFISDEKAPDPSFTEQRKDPEKENSHGPEPNRIIVGSQPGEILSNEREVSKHSVEDPVCIGPDPCGVRDFVDKVSIGVKGRKPVTARFINENGMGLMAQLVHETVAEQTVLPSA